MVNAEGSGENGGKKSHWPGLLPLYPNSQSQMKTKKVPRRRYWRTVERRLSFHWTRHWLSLGHAGEDLHSGFFHSSVTAEAIKYVYQDCFESPLSKEEYIPRKPPSEGDLRVVQEVNFFQGPANHSTSRSKEEPTTNSRDQENHWNKETWESELWLSVRNSVSSLG